MNTKKESEESKKTISIIGPSFRFLSGISYYTVSLSNSLSTHFRINAVLFRNMLPKKLFPGSNRVGTNLSNLEYIPEINKQESLDWYNPFGWHRAVKSIKGSQTCIFEWWTSSVSHMYLWIGLGLHLRKIPIVLEFHEVVDTLEEAIFPIRIYSKIMGRLIRKLASKYVVHSAADLKLVAERYHIPAEQISIVPHGLYDQYPIVDKKTARDALSISTEHVILFFGLLRPYKGVTYLIHAFEMLPKELLKDTALIIAGEPWEDSEAVAAVNNSPVKNQIHLYSEYISDDKIPDIFSAADVLTLPYTRASQSGVAHIGISYGMPIIASKVGGLVESMSKYEGTFFVSPMNEEELSKTLADVLLHHKNNKYKVPEDLRWESIADEWEKLL